jgi:hypothetical protein
MYIQYVNHFRKVGVIRKYYCCAGISTYEKACKTAGILIISHYNKTNNVHDTVMEVKISNS